MMKLETLLTALSRQAASIEIMLPDGSLVPPHFHVTEVGLVRKDFIDCGGTVRSSSACVLQLWIANDVNHRLDPAKLLRIFDLATPILKTTDLPVEFEYEKGTISQYPLTAVETTSAGILLRLGPKHTACLAPDLCVIEDQSCCSTTNCC